MTDLSASENTASNERSIRDWADLAEEMWSYLTGKVPRSTTSSLT